MIYATELAIHPLALRVPAMTDEEFSALKADIAANGLIDPITVHEQQVLDGRHRYRACLDTGTEPRFVDYDGDSPAAFVLAKNAKRRNLTPGQLAMLATDFLPDLEAERRARMAEAGRQHGRGMDSPAPTGAPLSPAEKKGGRAASSAAELVGTSARNVQRAKRVLEEDPDLADKVRAGEVTLRAADGAVSTSPKVRTKDGTRKRSPAEVFGKVAQKLAGFVPALREIDTAAAIADPTAPLAEWDKQLTDIIQTLHRLRGDIRKEMNK